MPVSSPVVISFVPRFAISVIETYCSQTVFDIERTFDLAVEIGKHLFTKGLDWVHPLLLA
jgi:hypothetical protein